MEGSKEEAMTPRSYCPHVTSLGEYTPADVDRKKEQSKCEFCDATGPNLWVCLHRDCFRVGCGEAYGDHSTRHNADNPRHCLHLNLSTLRIWCYQCKSEVFLENNVPQVPGFGRIIVPRGGYYVSKTPEPEQTESEVDTPDDNMKPRGLAGLQNIGNTCYMNAALQALSNTPPLTQFFLDCGSLVLCSDKKPGLTKSFYRLIQEMWHRKRPSYVVPSGILYGIRMVHPMFRGYQQHDTQEFLRCFMDQLHEELKEVVSVDINKDKEQVGGRGGGEEISDDEMEADGASSQSEGEEYETCDSGVSEKSEFSDDSADKKTTLWRNLDCHNKVTKSGFSPLPPDVKKELKDNLNLAQQRGSMEDLSNMEMEFSDAVSDTPMMDRLSRSSSPVQATEKIRTKLSIVQPLGKVVSAMAAHGLSSSPSSGRGTSSPTPMSMSTGSLPKLSPMSLPRRKRPPKYRSVISDIFDGRILSSVQCLTCDRVSTTVETFQDLSLPIPSRDHLHVLHQGSLTPQKGGFSSCSDMYNSHQGWLSWMWDWMRSWFWGPTVSLHDCLAAFFSADELKGDNMYSCERCKKLRNGVKYSKVLELPEVLCVHLKRFRHELMFSSKIGSFVSFPLENLDMKPYLHKECPSQVTTYDLVAVICHHGTAGAGHYTCYALNYINDQWYEFDDQYVTEVSPDTIQNCEAYVLFYKKSSEEMNRRRERTVELMERAQNEPSLMQFYISKQWVNKFNTFAEPGPIDNSDFLCSHGAVHPSKAPYVYELCTVLSQSVWEYLHRTFGGGAACNCLYECATCRQEQEAMRRRQKQELEEFVRLNKEFQAQESASVVYAIAMSWFRRWEEFVRGKELEPPGPIDNSSIVAIKIGQQVVKMGSDYAQLSEELWHLFHSTYGGGPELLLRQGPPTSPPTSPRLPQPSSASTCSPSPPSRCNVANTSPPVPSSPAPPPAPNPAPTPVPAPIPCARAHSSDNITSVHQAHLTSRATGRPFSASADNVCTGRAGMPIPLSSSAPAATTTNNTLPRRSRECSLQGEKEEAGRAAGEPMTVE